MMLKYISLRYKTYGLSYNEIGAFDKTIPIFLRAWLISREIFNVQPDEDKKKCIIIKPDISSSPESLNSWIVD